jgi:hypothetical protein
LDLSEGNELISHDKRNCDVIFPYLNGDDLNSRPDQSPSRWAINFFDWPLDRSAAGSWYSADDHQRSVWLREGRVPRDYPGPVAMDYGVCLESASTKKRSARWHAPCPGLTAPAVIQTRKEMTGTSSAWSGDAVRAHAGGDPRDLAPCSGRSRSDQRGILLKKSEVALGPFH